MKVSIIKYNAGNVHSVASALRRLHIEPEITDNPDILKTSDRVVFPGVGEASTAMHYLREKGLDKLIPALTQPFLGICLGLQLMCQSSEENNTECLGIFDVKVKKFPEGLKIPHMGWNNFAELKSPLYKGISPQDFVYFVHSYYAPVSIESIAVTDYGIKFSAAMAKDNFFGMQYHPEKSGKVGAKILENFLRI
ncbi:MAG: imidazole glycerol phosphate synthase subunit HisH [Candidatus Marinimicrobia bacterium]|nr:imidazole glycerol phosphate synthase subunit HisH [Candidatus Neomarinimicrobiota bacterium]